MKAITTLIDAGYDVRLVHRDGMDVVEAKRTPASTMSLKAAGVFVTELLKRQDEAVEWFREQLRAEWMRLAAGLDDASELDQAIAIHELALNSGQPATSDGFDHRDCIEALKAGMDVHDYVANKGKGIAFQVGGAVRLSAPASGRLRQAVRHGEMTPLAV